ncbi:MAG TPA: hypothetical protein VGG99_02720 [Acetobacteraceae bacterium]|jgi:hypothetical protein
MSGTGFVVAMEAAIELARYDVPMRRVGSRGEWIIVSRWGADGEFLSISQTGIAAEGAGDAPDGLQPDLTFLGLRMTAAGEAAETAYLMLRNLPPDLMVAGVFAPTDGYALVGLTGGLRLAASGRYAHSRGEHNGQTVFRDMPNPPPRPSLATAWHITASRRPWSGEFYPFA